MRRPFLRLGFVIAFGLGGWTVCLLVDRSIKKDGGVEMNPCLFVTPSAHGSSSATAMIALCIRHMNFG